MPSTRTPSAALPPGFAMARAALGGLALCAALAAATATATAQTAPQARAAEPPISSWSPAVLQQPTAWYASAAARTLADSVIQYQSPRGGWPKSTNLAVPPRGPGDIPPEGRGRANSFDNDATTLPMSLLARLIDAGAGSELHRQAFERGLAYVFEAQYPNGGWPQFHPRRTPPEYYSRITFNDDAMVNVLTLLRGVASGRAPYGFVAPAQRQAAATAVQRGLALILRTQIRVGDRLTGWCAQYDEATLEPAWARAYEPPSISGNETVGIVRWLMEIEQPGPEVVKAVDAAVAWLHKVAIRGQRLEAFTNAEGQADRRVVADPSAAPIWARFHDLKSERPIFLGRDSVVHHAFAEIEHERRNGYAYFGVQPAALLAAYPAWKASVGQGSAVRLSEVVWHGVGAYRIEMPMGTVYFEKDKGVSGFKSMLDLDGNDWIASYLPPGPNGEFRGYPNSVGNFGHAGRDSGSVTRVVGGKTAGDVVILESSNADFSFQYWFFADRVAIKVLRSKGEYNFLWEGVAGGSADADDYFVSADGVRRTPSGEFADFTPEWIVIGDPKARQLTFLAKTPDDDAPNENHRQIRKLGGHNMDLYGFGRTGAEQGYKVRGMSGNEHVALIGFLPATMSHEQVQARVERMMKEPFALP